MRNRLDNIKNILVTADDETRHHEKSRTVEQTVNLWGVACIVHFYHLDRARIRVGYLALDAGFVTHVNFSILFNKRIFKKKSGTVTFLRSNRRSVNADSNE